MHTQTHRRSHKPAISVSFYMTANSFVSIRDRSFRKNSHTPLQLKSTLSKKRERERFQRTELQNIFYPLLHPKRQQKTKTSIHAKKVTTVLISMTLLIICDKNFLKVLNVFVTSIIIFKRILAFSNKKSLIFQPWLQPH